MSDSEVEQKPQVPVNYASAYELATIPGIGRKLSKAIVAVRQSSGNITAEILTTISRRQFSVEELKGLDFAQNVDLANLANRSESESESTSEYESGSEAEVVPEPLEKTQAVMGEQASLPGVSFFNGVWDSAKKWWQTGFKAEPRTFQKQMRV